MFCNLKTAFFFFFFCGTEVLGKCCITSSCFERGSQFVAQAGLELAKFPSLHSTADSPASASQVLELQVWKIIPSLQNNTPFKKLSLSPLVSHWTQVGKGKCSLKIGAHDNLFTLNILASLLLEDAGRLEYKWSWFQRNQSSEEAVWW
jgi:hypothetical protein